MFGKRRRQSNWTEIMEVAKGLHVEARTTFVGDPALGMKPPGDLSQLGIYLSETTAQIPVLLVEPREMVVMVGPSGERYEGQVEAAVSAGMHRMAPGTTIVHAAEGWELRRTSRGVNLLDRTGEAWARCRLTLDPEWISAAASAGWVLVLYGPLLGVRTPPGRLERTCTPAKRLKEFRRGRKLGFVAAGFVHWQTN
jgi:hypothetical protein